MPATLTCAEDFDRATFYLRDIRGAVEHLESILPQHLDTASPALPTDGNNYQIMMDPGELISLRRSFTRSMIDYQGQGAPLKIAFQEDLRTEASLSLGQHLGFNFSSTDTDTRNLQGFVLDSKHVEVMGLNQTFGKGDSASGLSLSRTITDSAPYLGVASTSKVEALEFKSGLTKDYELALKATRTETDGPSPYKELDLQGLFTVHFSGGDSPLGFARNTKDVAGQIILTEKVDLALPFAKDGGKGILEHHSLFTETGAVLTKTRTTHFMMPAQLFGEAGTVDYTIFGENKGAGLMESRTAKLVNPFKLAGKVFGLEETLINVDQAGVSTDTLLTKLTAPMFDGQAVFQRQTVTVTTPTGETEQEQVAVIMPTIKVSDRMSITAQRISTDSEGVGDQDVTNFNVTVSPFKPWQLEAKYQMDDKGPMAATKTRQLHSKYLLRPNLSLEGHLTEAEVPGLASNTLRLMEIVRDRGTSSLGFRAGVASYGAPNAEMESGRRIEVSAGNPSGIAVTAAYSEYDPGTWARYPDDQTVALSVQHGDPNDLAVRWRYEDQPTRIEPLQAVDLAMGALGGTLQVGYQNNPLGPDGKTVRQAAQYEASLGRKVGEINLQLGYRYLDYDETDTIDQNFRLQMDGGDEAKNGKLALAYQTGDFCVPVPNEALPGSRLDLSYSRVWGDEGRLTLTLQRKTAPMDTLLEGNTEGRLEFKKIF